MVLVLVFAGVVFVGWVLLQDDSAAGEKAEVSDTFRVGVMEARFSENQIYLSFQIEMMVFDPLLAEIIKDKDSDSYKKIALDHLEVSEDRKTCDITIRKGISFHDGSEMTSEDLDFTISHIKLSNWMNTHVNFTHQITGPYSVRIHSVDRDCDLIDIYGHGILNRRHEERRARNEGEDPQLMGSGPYKLVSWDWDNKIARLERWDRYWGGKAKYKYMDIHFYDNSDAQTMALLEGKLDYISNVNAEDFSYISSNIDITSFSYVHHGYGQLVFNQKDPKFANQKVREAISLLIDRDDLVENINGLRGAGAPTDTIFHYIAPRTRPEVTRKRDIPKAFKLLEEAGWRKEGKKLVRDGKQFTLKLYGFSDNSTELKGILRLLGRYLNDAGMSCELKILEYGDTLERVENHDFEIMVLFWNRLTSLDDPNIITGNEVRYPELAKDRELKQIVERMKKARSSRAGDEKMLELKRQLQARYRELAWNLPLFYYTSFGAVRGGSNLNEAMLADPNYLAFFVRPALMQGDSKVGAEWRR